MTTDRIVDATAETLAALLETGLGNVLVNVRRRSDGFYLDWADATFKASGWTTQNAAMTEVGATGQYERVLDLAALVNRTANDVYVVTVTSATSRYSPQVGELKAGDWVQTIHTNLDGTVTSRLAAGSYTAPDNAGIAAIKLKTDQLTFTTPNIVDALATLSPTQITAIAAAVIAQIGPAIWTYTVRSLTQSAAQVAAIVAGQDVTVLRGDYWDVFLQDIGSLLGRGKLWFTAKRSKDDADSASVVQITEAGGLVVLNGAPVTGGGTAQGILHVEDEGLGRLTIELAGTASKDVAEQSLFYDIQILDSAGKVVTRTSGVMQVVADVTREVA